MSNPDIPKMIEDLRIGADSVEGEGYWPVFPQLLRDAATQLQRMHHPDQRRSTVTPIPHSSPIPGYRVSVITEHDPEEPIATGTIIAEHVDGEATAIVIHWDTPTN